MILKQAHYAFIGLLIILITIAAVACTMTGNGTPSPVISPSGGPELTPGGRPTSTYQYHPNISLLPRRGKAGTEVTIVGGGFPVGTDVEIRITGEETGAPNDYITKAEVQQHGTIQVSFKMPDRWPSGEPITIPRVTILASTPDFAEKATAPFLYETNVTPEAAPTGGSTLLAP